MTRTHLHLVFAAPADPPVLAAVSRWPGVRVSEHPPLGGAALGTAAAGADVLITRSSQRVDRAVFEAARGRELVVVQASSGHDNIDHAAAEELGVRVVIVDPGNARAVAELTLLSLLALARGIREHWQHTAAGAWPDRERLDEREIAGKTLGLVGLGRVGTRIADLAAAMKMRVLAVDPYIPAQRFERHRALAVDSLEQLLPELDFLSLHCPLTDETRGMIDARRLALLPRGAMLVNTARGAIVDETALLAALDEDDLAGAAIDVYREEPPRQAQLVAHPRVLATPHMGGHTRESHEARASHLLEALEAIVRNRG
ncbi:MAG: hypothetical protein JSV80_08600 [Acidobacteriota bacterium]|nr:MAG: hypothetical protein JSV80_08600 [Acidobacteriota bacterium]